MTDEQTDKGDTGGKKLDKSVEATPKDSLDVSTDSSSDTPLYTKTKAIVERLEAANKVMAENLTKQEKLQSEQLLGGTSGGRVETKPKDPDQELADKLLAEDED